MPPLAIQPFVPDPRLGVECFDCGYRPESCPAETASGDPALLGILIGERVMTPVGLRAWTLCVACWRVSEQNGRDEIEHRARREAEAAAKAVKDAA